MITPRGPINARGFGSEAAPATADANAQAFLGPPEHAADELPALVSSEATPVTPFLSPVEDRGSEDAYTAGAALQKVASYGGQVVKALDGVVSPLEVRAYELARS